MRKSWEEPHQDREAEGGAALVVQWLGESERAVRGLFATARAAAPCVIFFDEMVRPKLHPPAPCACAGALLQLCGPVFSWLPSCREGERVVPNIVSCHPILLSACGDTGVH